MPQAAKFTIFHKKLTDGSCVKFVMCCENYKEKVLSSVKKSPIKNAISNIS